jgi:general secretion pathway protein G
VELLELTTTTLGYMLLCDSTDGVAGASSGDEPHPFPSSEEPRMLHTLRQARAGVTNRLDEARKTSRKLAEAGFTLIELLIVIVILGILAAVVVFSVQGIQDKGTDAACASDAASANVAIQAYYAQTGNYPTTLAALTTTGSKLLTNVTLSGSDMVIDGSDYTITYAVTGGGSGYTLTPAGAGLPTSGAKCAVISS